jgi:hypothetical protein
MRIEEQTCPPSLLFFLSLMEKSDETTLTKSQGCFRFTTRMLTSDTGKDTTWKINTSSQYKEVGIVLLAIAKKEKILVINNT